MVLPLLLMNPIVLIGLLVIFAAVALIGTIVILANPLYFIAALLMVGALGYGVARYYISTQKSMHGRH